MFFYLSKLFVFFTRPSNLLFLLAFAGIALLFTRYARAGRRLLAGSVLVMMVVGISPLGGLLILALENRFPPWDPARGAPDGIIVLGGAISPEISAARDTVALGEAAERMTEIAELARRYPQARIVYSGGSSSLFGGVREADYAGRLWESFGIARERILLERESRNTAENAAFSKAMLQPKPGERWLLVTSSWHMPRAVGAFRQAGFTVEPYPVDWVSTGKTGNPGLARSFAAGLHALDNVTHEWGGMVAYWLTGRMSELFPGPRQPACDKAAPADTCRR
jgi:uncharacterized SAM-binding protein YcdF (DUF218 family)